MRSEQLLKALKENISAESFARARWFSSKVEFKGGWEVWLQAEIAYALGTSDIRRKFTREKPYPGDPLQRKCDFYVERDGNVSKDETYLELKCINSGVDNPFENARNRFFADVVKITNVQNSLRLLCTAVLATWGVFKDEEVERWAETINLDNAWVLDVGAQHTTTLRGVERGGVDRLFIVAYSP